MLDNEDRDFALIDAAAKSGRPCIVKRGPEYARAKWVGGMWAYDIPGAAHQLDFEPTHYAALRHA